MTGQTPEIIIHQGKAHSLLTLPFEPYIDKRGGHEKVFPKLAFRSTANWRGYVARWEVCQKRLFLTGIVVFGFRPSAEASGFVDLDPEDSRDETTMIIRLHHLFDSTPVFAQWWTGLLVAATGPMVCYVHAGFASLYASYRVFRVVQGRVRSVRDFDGKEWARRNGRYWPEDAKPEVCEEDTPNDDASAKYDWRRESDRHLKQLYREREEIDALYEPHNWCDT